MINTQIQLLKYTSGLALLFSFTAAADSLDTLQFRASVNRAYDNNLFRRSTNEVSEQITTSTLGIKLDKTYSLQRVVADISYVDSKYNRNDYLDFGATNYNGTWFWSLTPSLTGSVSTLQTETLANFGDFLNTNLNITTFKNNEFKALYSPHKIWGLIAGYSQSSLQNSATFTAISDFEAAGFDYGISYNFASGATLTFLGHNREGDFKKRPLDPIVAFDDGYSENEYEINLFFQEQNKSKMSGKIGYLAREYNNFTIRDYNSYIGSLNYDLIISGKLKTSVGISRALAPFETLTTAYSINDTVTAQLFYDVSPKVQTGVNLRYGERDFGGRGQFDSSRLDKEDAIGGFISWSPIRNIAFTLRSTKSSRRSNVSNFNFDDTLTNVTLDFKI